MSFGYLGDTSTKIKQQVKNNGVISVSEAYELEKAGQLGGSLELIEQQTVSSVSAVDFTSIKESKYDVHFLTWTDFSYSVDSTRLIMQFYESGVLETASVYEYGTEHGESGGTFSEQRNTGDSDLRIGGGNGDDTNEKANGYVYIYNAGNSIKYTFITTQNLEFQNTVFRVEFGGGVLPQASVVDGIRLKMHDAGNISGTTKLYGVKQL